MTSLRPVAMSGTGLIGYLRLAASSMLRCTLDEVQLKLAQSRKQHKHYQHVFLSLAAADL